jgi:hypothetical protein
LIEGHRIEEGSGLAAGVAHTQGRGGRAGAGLEIEDAVACALPGTNGGNSIVEIVNASEQSVAAFEGGEDLARLVVLRVEEGEELRIGGARFHPAVGIGDRNAEVVSGDRFNFGGGRAGGWLFLRGRRVRRKQRSEDEGERGGEAHGVYP